MTDLVARLLSGAHNREEIVLAGVKHDMRCLEAANEIKRLRARLRTIANTDWKMPDALGMAIDEAKEALRE